MSGGSKFLRRATTSAGARVQSGGRVIRALLIRRSELVLYTAVTVPLCSLRRVGGSGSLAVGAADAVPRARHAVRAPVERGQRSVEHRRRRSGRSLRAKWVPRHAGE